MLNLQYSVFKNDELTAAGAKNICIYKIVAFGELLFLVQMSNSEKFIKEFRRDFKQASGYYQKDNEIRFSAAVMGSMFILY